jgi:hypothetical protein
MRVRQPQRIVAWRCHDMTKDRLRYSHGIIYTQKGRVHPIIPRGIFSIFLLLIFILTSGCGIQMVAGSLPDVGSLEKTLQIGQSKETDVINALGYPFGRGREMMPIGQKQRTLLSYYYEVGSFQDSRRMFLFVFLDGDKYDGYMWFSSLPK